MEEVDNIIIESLRNLNCNLEDEVKSLKEFSVDTVVRAIVCCLEAITPGTTLPHSLPPSMSQRLKLATTIAEHIKDLGFRGDMGYQSILYCNEIEVRRILMFLVERLPRDANKIIHSEDTGKIPTLMREIKRQVAQSLQSPWVPSSILKNGLQNVNDTVIKTGFGDNYALQTQPLLIPNVENDSGDAKLWNVIPDVSQQCHYNKLIPSVLFKSKSPVTENHLSKVLEKTTNSESWGREDVLKISAMPEAVSNAVKIQNKVEATVQSVNVEDSANKIQKLGEDIEYTKQNLVALQEELKTLETKWTQLLDMKKTEENALKTSLTQLKVKSKSQAILDSNEIGTLETLIENGTQHLLDLTKQWAQMQTPLLEQYRSLQQNLSIRETEVKQAQEQSQNMKIKQRKVTEELKEKENLHAQLNEEVNRLQKNTNRSAYTRRIMEIIANIKKQTDEIDKVLVDTKEVQKDINNLNGQLERSFTLADEVIFRDAKSDDTARKAYKLLASLHTDCGEVVQAATELGLIIRESRNLEEQVSTEESRETAARLERVNADLAQVRKETAALLKQNQMKM